MNHIDFTHSIMKRINQQVMKNLLTKEKGPRTENKRKSPEGVKSNSRAVMFAIKVLQKNCDLKPHISKMH